MITLYWDIGRLIVERQKEYGWGRAVVENLSRDLRLEFSSMPGFSTQNLWRMKQFYQAYAHNEKLSPLVREIGWTHNVIILMNCKDILEREFYIRMTRRMGWTKSTLMREIEGNAYAKTFLSQTNFHKTLPAAIRDQARLAVKDEYMFDFLELGEEHAERELERGLVARIDRFLREMGGMLSYVGRQYRIEVGSQEYFIDILLFHRQLRSLVALELKVGEFIPEYVGKMKFYLTALDRHVKAEGENPPIGIIVCKTKDKTVVEYALQDISKPIGVATYTLTDRLPKTLIKELPAPHQVARLFQVI